MEKRGHNFMMWKARLKAAGVHALFSILLLIVALWLVIGLWYPLPLVQAMGVTHIYGLILVVDLIAGPLLTLVVFNRAKRVKRDLAIIVILQLTAYLYGLNTIAQGRPVWQVFVIDDIELVRAVDIKEEAKDQFKPEFKTSLFKRPRWVSAVYSTDPKIAQKQKEAEMFDGVSLAARPETYQPLHNRAKEIEQKLKPISVLKQFNSNEAINMALKDKENLKGWLPVKAFEEDMVVLFNNDIQPVGIVALKPWK